MSPTPTSLVASLPSLALAALLVGVAGCAGTGPHRPVLPGRHIIVRQPLVIYSDFTLAPHHRLLDELIALRGDLVRELQIPSSDEPIDVYLFESPERFARFMHHRFPELPDRRAFFIKTDTQLRVLAQWGDRVAEDLRHEVTHGYLHAAIPELPIWLDEGLAEYFEVPRHRHGLNRLQLRQLLDRMEQGRFEPDMRRLEALNPADDLSPDDYAESWAWVHYLLHSGPEYGDLLRAYLADLRHDAAAEPISSRLGRLEPDAPQALREHIRRLGARLGATPLHAATAAE